MNLEKKDKEQIQKFCVETAWKDIRGGGSNYNAANMLVQASRPALNEGLRIAI
jgi:hypothetical protein